MLQYSVSLINCTNPEFCNVVVYMVAVIDAKAGFAYVSDVAEQNDIIRKAIMAEYDRRDLNPYKLWKLVEGEGVSRATVYAFVNGKTTLSTEHAGKIMQALGLTIQLPHKSKSRRTEN